MGGVLSEIINCYNDNGEGTTLFNLSVEFMNVKYLLETSNLIILDDENFRKKKKKRKKCKHRSFNVFSLDFIAILSFDFIVVIKSNNPDCNEWQLPPIDILDTHTID